MIPVLCFTLLFSSNLDICDWPVAEHRVEAPETAPTALPNVSGTASWYANGSGLYAAAGPALRTALGGAPEVKAPQPWRGLTVSVWAGAPRDECRDKDTDCVKVELTDWCQCYWKEPHERLIDLSPDAFEALAPLSRGVTKVTVTW